MTHRAPRLAGAIIGAAALAALAACAPKTGAPPAADTAPAVDTSKDVAAIKASADEFNAAYKAHDAGKIAAGGAADEISYFPGAPVAHGPGDSKALAKQFAADPALGVVITPDRTEVAKSGDLGYVVGHAVATMTNPKTHAVEHANSGYVAVFRKQAGGDWKAIAVSVSPGPGAPGAPPRS